jgi:hypothetical protein
MRHGITQGCFLLNILLVLVVVVGFILTQGIRESSGNGQYAGLILFVGAFTILIAASFYQLWSTFIDRGQKATRKRVNPAKSRFIFTRDGEIIEIVDEKRKRGGDETVE